MRNYNSAHTHTEGQQVKISGVVGMTQLNGNTYLVKAATATGVTLKSLAGVDLDSTAFTAYISGGKAVMDDNVDGTAFTAYVSGGKARLVVTTISGLEHLEGEAVAVLADGGVVHNPNDPALTIKTVSNGAITIANGASRIHLGLPYISDLVNIGVDLTSLNGFGDSLARWKSIPVVKIRVQDTAGIRMAPMKTISKSINLKDLMLTKGPVLLNQVIEKSMAPRWDHDGTVFIRQLNPLPMTILSLMPR